MTSKNKIRMPSPPFYREVNDYPEIRQYLLESKTSEAKNTFPDRNGNRISTADTCLKPVNIMHDPLPEYGFTVYPFESLQSAQWHLLAHGVADHWLQPHRLYMLGNRLNPAELKALWKAFMVMVPCKRWATMDFVSDPSGAKNRWYRMRQNFAHHGCMDCIKEQGTDTFITCCRFFESHRLWFLKKIKQWVVDTVQDNPYMNFYAQSDPELPDVGELQRRHIHLINNDRNTENIHAYVAEPGRSGNISIFLMILQKTSDLHNPTYRVKTAYAISETKQDFATRYITKFHGRNFIQSKPSVQILHKCHPSNWVH